MINPAVLVFGLLAVFGLCAYILRALSLHYIPRLFGVTVKLMMLGSGKIVALVKLRRECAFRYVLYFHQGNMRIEGPHVERYRWSIIEGVFAGAYGIVFAGIMLYFAWAAVIAWAMGFAAGDDAWALWAQHLLRSSQHFPPVLFLTMGFVMAAMYVGLFTMPSVGGFYDIVDEVEYQINDFRDGDMIPFLLWIKNARLDVKKSRPLISLYYMMRVAPYIARTQDIEYQKELASFFFKSNKLEAAYMMWESIAVHPDGSPRMLDAAACEVLYSKSPKTAVHWQYALALIDAALDEAPGKVTMMGTKGAILVESGETAGAETLLEECRSRTESVADRLVATAYLAKLAVMMGNTARTAQLLAILPASVRECALQIGEENAALVMRVREEAQALVNAKAKTA